MFENSRLGSMIRKLMRNEDVLYLIVGKENIKVFARKDSVAKMLGSRVQGCKKVRGSRRYVITVDVSDLLR